MIYVYEYIEYLWVYAARRIVHKIQLSAAVCIAAAACIMLHAAVLLCASQ